MYQDEMEEHTWLRKNLVEARGLVADLRRVLERCGLVDELDDEFAGILNQCDKLWEKR